MDSRSPSRERYGRSPTPPSRYSRSPSPVRRRRSPTRSASPAPRRNGRYRSERSETRSRSRTRSRSFSRGRSESPLRGSTKVSSLLYIFTVSPVIEALVLRCRSLFLIRRDNSLALFFNARARSSRGTLLTWVNLTDCSREAHKEHQRGPSSRSLRPIWPHQRSRPAHEPSM